MWRVILTLALALALTAPARAAQSFTFAAGTYPPPGTFQPFEPDHAVRVGSVFAYQITVPWQDGDPDLVLTFDKRVTWISGTGTCRQGASALEQVCGANGPAVVWFWVRVTSGGAPIVTTATYKGQTLTATLPVARTRIYLPITTH